MIAAPRQVEGDPRWAKLPADLRRFVVTELAESPAPDTHAAYLLEQADRRRAWRERGAADAKPCPKGCGVALLWRYEADGEGRKRRVGVTRAGQLHACEPDGPP